MSEKVYTAQNVADLAACDKLRPTEAMFIGKKGYRRFYRKDGSYSWRYRYKPNEHGKLTKEAQEVQEAWMPYAKATAARQEAFQATVPRERLRDSEGGIRYLEPALAGSVARQRGWTHAWRPRGCPVERGLRGGMLWSYDGEKWRALGVKCLGRPLSGRKEVPKRGLQVDPDGNPHRFIQGEWRNLG